MGVPPAVPPEAARRPRRDQAVETICLWGGVVTQTASDERVQEAEKRLAAAQAAFNGKA